MNPISRITLGLTTILLAGCGPFFTLNTFPPGQHPIMIVPEPAMIDLAPKFLEPGVPQADYPQVTLQVDVYPLRNFRGATFKAYSATYHEMSGVEITAAALPKRDFASPIAIPVPTAEETTRIPIAVPLIHAGLTEFLRTLPPGSTINSRVTLNGEDAERNEIAFSLNVPIRVQQP